MKTTYTTTEDFERLATKQDELELLARKSARDGAEVMPGIRRMGGSAVFHWSWEAHKNGRPIASGCCHTLLEAVLELRAVKYDFGIKD